jgi:antirestriction protein
LDIDMSIPTNDDETIDSRDVIERIEELENNPIEGDEIEELEQLRKLAEQSVGYAADWQYGETLIRDDYFKQYAMDLADELGALETDRGWPANYIDWNAAADALKQDYTEIDFDGVTYWVR